LNSEIIVAILALVGTGLGSYSGFKLTSYRVEQLEKRLTSTITLQSVYLLLRNKSRLSTTGLRI